MNEIICPHCGKAFKVDEAGYANILKQVRDKEFDAQLHERLELAEKEKANAVELAKEKLTRELQTEAQQKEATINELKAQLNAGKTEKELAVNSAVSKVEKERDELQNQLNQAQLDNQKATDQAGQERHYRGIRDRRRGRLDIPHGTSRNGRLDIFVTFPKSELIVDLSKITRALDEMGYEQWEKEGIIVEGIPVRFLPAETGLLKEAYEKASKENIEGTQTRIMTLEYLCAIMLEPGRPKDKIRLVACWGHKNLNMDKFRKICSRHRLGKKLERFQTLYIEGLQ